VTALDLAREIQPDFPSSSGRPFRTPDADLLERRSEFAAAARRLETGAAAELAARTWRLWMAARDLDGGRAFLGEVLDRHDPEPSRWRSIALYGDGLLAWWQGKGEDSRGLNEEALEIAQALDDAEALALARLGLSRIAVDDGDLVRGRELAQQARAAAATVSEAHGQAPLHLEAQATRLAGDYETAAKLFEESLALNRRIDDPSMVPVELHNLGLVEIHRGNADAAERCFGELPPSDEPYDRALTRFLDAAIAYRRDDLERATALLDEAQGIFDEAGIVPVTDDKFELDWLREQLACAAR
jgi:tetratricopeptide (TPR) repeat protein